MAYSVSVVNGVKLSAWVDYGDNFPFQIALYDDDAGTIPSDLSGKDFVLGIEDDKGNSICEILGQKTGNVILFPIYWEEYKDAVIEGKKYKFDYWDRANRNTKIPLSDFEFRAVAHKTAEV